MESGGVIGLAGVVEGASVVGSRSSAKAQGGERGGIPPIRLGALAQGRLKHEERANVGRPCERETEEVATTGQGVVIEICAG